MLAFAFMLALSAPAQQSKKSSGPCDDATTQLNMNLCAQRLFEAADRERKAAYSKLLGLAGPTGAKLTIAEESWRDFLRKQCDFEDSRYEGGSMRPLIRALCMEKLTRERVKYHRDLIRHYTPK